MALLDSVDPTGLLEYSVVYTDRSVNHMSQQFQQAMRDIHDQLTTIYNAQAAVIVPGSGTFAMEAVVRQFAPLGNTIVVRNGWFSFRWTQILDAMNPNHSSTVFKAQRQNSAPKSPFQPAKIADVTTAIQQQKPAVVFAPHVETSAGMMLSDDYIKQLADAAHEVGALMVLDCIASGAAWVDMQALGVDVLISAPQKGWSSTPCCGLVMLNERALSKMAEHQSDSFACNLNQWHQIMQAYINGGHAYHSTMPTDGIIQLRDTITETMQLDLAALKEAQFRLGNGIRSRLADKGFPSVAADGFGAPGVVVCYTDDKEMHTGKKFAEQGMQIAAGVPLKCDEPEDYQTFRIGLFGLDKLKDVDAALTRFDSVLDKVLQG